MTKQEFVSEVARRAQLSNRDAGKAVDAFLEAVVDTLKGGGEVAFTGFGKFSTAHRKAAHGGQSAQPDREGAHPGGDAFRSSRPAAVSSRPSRPDDRRTNDSPKSPPRIERPPSGGLFICREALVSGGPRILRRERGGSLRGSARSRGRAQGRAALRRPRSRSGADAGGSGRRRVLSRHRRRRRRASRSPSSRRRRSSRRRAPTAGPRSPRCAATRARRACS